MTKNNHGGRLSGTDAVLDETETRLLNTLRMMGATSLANAEPSAKIERRSHLKHGPMMHALMRLERRGAVGRVVGRKDVEFYLVR